MSLSFMPRATTIEQLYRTWTGIQANAGVGFTRLNRADDNIKTSTSGAHNNVYTTDLVVQMSGDSTPYGILGESGWPSSGFSTISAYPTQSANNGVDKFGGTPEGGNLADTIKPTFATISPIARIMQQRQGMSTTQALLANTGDNVVVTPEKAREFAIGNFKRMISESVVEDQSQFAGSGASAAFNYASHARFASLDNLVSNKAQADAIDTHSTNNGWFNSYNGGFNRRTSTAFDSVVESAGSSLSTQGTLTKAKLAKVPYDIKGNSDDYPDLALTSSFVKYTISQLYEGEVRYTEGSDLRETTVTFGMSGVVDRGGTGIGLKVASIYGVPIIETSADMTSSATNDNGRIYFLTRNSGNNGGIRPILSISTLFPLTAYTVQALNNPGGPDVVGSYNNILTYVTQGEVVCTKPTAQGKIIGIQN